MIRTPVSTDDLQANQRLAEALGLCCPHCGELATVTADHRQATRTTPCELLGITLRCECAADFLSGRPVVGFVSAVDLEPLVRAGETWLNQLYRQRFDEVALTATGATNAEDVARQVAAEFAARSAAEFVSAQGLVV